jgi:FeS assembly SUF system regulator
VIRISKKADYAIVLLTFLARHAVRADPAEVPTSAQELANAIPIGKPTIANLLKVLTRAGILESSRGVHGGYRLAKPARDITLAAILEAVDGPLALVECASVAHLRDSPCDLTSCCTTHHAMQLLQSKIATLLDRTTLDEFVRACPVSSILQTSASYTLQKSSIR